MFRFIGDLFLFEISEAANVSAYITTVTANDSDVTSTFNQVFYSLFDGGGTFQINNTTGVVTVNKPLDREQNDRYELQLSAFNLVNGSQAAITIKTVSDIAQNTETAPNLLFWIFFGDAHSLQSFRRIPEIVHFHKLFAPGK